MTLGFAPHSNKAAYFTCVHVGGVIRSAAVGNRIPPIADLLPFSISQHLLQAQVRRSSHWNTNKDHLREQALHWCPPSSPSTLRHYCLCAQLVYGFGVAKFPGRAWAGWGVDLDFDAVGESFGAGSDVVGPIFSIHWEPSEVPLAVSWPSPLPIRRTFRQLPMKRRNPNHPGLLFSFLSLSLSNWSYSLIVAAIVSIFSFNLAIFSVATCSFTVHSLSSFFLFIVSRKAFPTSFADRASFWVIENSRRKD